MNDHGTPVTRAELREELAGLREERRAELREELAGLREDMTSQIRRERRAELREELAKLREELAAEIRNERRAELREELETFRGGMRLEIAEAMNYVATTIGAQIADQTEELRREIASAAMATGGQNRRDMAAVDDRYRDLPGRVAVLERDLVEHRQNKSLHPLTDDEE